MGQLVEVRKGLGSHLAAELLADAVGSRGAYGQQIKLSGKQYAAIAAGGAGLIGASELVGRKVGSNRYKAGKHVQDGFIQGPSVSRGYMAAERKQKGARYGINATGDAVTGPAMVRKAFASRDQNSSIGTRMSHAGPKGEGLTSVTNAHTSRTGAFAGKQRGVGRNLSRDQNSTPGHTVIRTPTIRQINGKFAGEGQGVKVFHPARYGSSNRQARDNRLGIWRKDRDDVSRTFSGKQKEKVGKSVMQIPDGKKAADVLMGGGGRAKSTRRRDIALGAAGGTVTGAGATLATRKRGEVRKGMLGPVDLLVMAPHTGARVGRRIPA